ncbi:lipopolysaccharide assembly protein LapA domain-containing protein [Roseobacter sp. OBYS 0001]|uniref:lipopolysaccharide assembly protein LapA domain-containing protein n=1 Tax=Roseobacter sp. OBYS 0001 TaxID=882651 RepID=UPI001BB89538|nr:lipopolysaccharide assembly protein LapA domain-containing protein [Roseobacter sp. OBYS 0001]GIT87738.1 phosphoribosylanthranilate isomerase [Roseobacter sp. OBYS 0001]
MRYIKYALIAVFGIALIAIAVANRGYVSIQLIPNEVAGWFAVNPQIELPLFIIIFGGIIVGLFVGFVWEWMREYAQRAEAARQAREMRRLQREVKRLKGEKHEGKDEVIALLEEAS